MYLRLKGAGLFFKSLNTPERIDIVEKMGHLQRKDAEFLLQATTFYRALDHAIRLVTGRAEERLPQGEEDRERVAELMRLWVDNSLTEASLEGKFAHLQNQMRRLFETVFA
jgi:glutamate-ammonia-ligase adenylyltransferase